MIGSQQFFEISARFSMYLGYSEWNESPVAGFRYCQVTRNHPLAKARQRLLQNSVSHSGATYASRIFFFFFLPLFDNAAVLVRYAICGKATWLSAGKSGRQLCTPSLVPPFLPPLSITNVLSFLISLHRSKRLVFFRHSRVWFLSVTCVSFKALDVLIGWRFTSKRNVASLSSSTSYRFLINKSDFQ